ncbi:MAG: Txe/YoeB family addiction module toxin [Bacteroidaceae bacterium]|nr:Txe/YoeB family addiction module toxin [Bacteroidaceae bacterium]
MYDIVYTEEAKQGLAWLRRDEPKAHAKAVRLLQEVMHHPRTGTGKPEQLTGERAGQWSRRITKKHRLVYEIHETEVVVLVLTAYGHYNDK